MGYDRVCWENQIRASSVMYKTVNRQRNTGGTHESRKFVSSQMVGSGGDGVGWGGEELFLDLPLMQKGD